MKLRLFACLIAPIFCCGLLEAANVERLLFTNVTNIAVVQAGVFKANLEYGVAVVEVRFEAKGKEYLESAQRRIQRAEKNVARKVEDYNKEPAVVVKKKTEHYSDGSVMGTRTVVTDVKVKEPLTLSKAPDFSVYGRKQPDGSYLLIGTTEIASPGGIKRYTW